MGICAYNDPTPLIFGQLIILIYIVNKYLDIDEAF